MYGLLEYERDLNELRAQGARVFSIGKTELGRDIYAVQKGSVEGGQVLVQASICLLYTSDAADDAIWV